MSTGLALAATTAVLKGVLERHLPDLSPVIGSVAVSSKPPDRITTGQSEASQLNLFLYRVTPNTGWCSTDLPQRDGAGNRVTNAPLALDLHYLLSAYGAADLHNDMLLGAALGVLHEVPVLTRLLIRSVLTTSGAPPADIALLATAGLADQEEAVKISPEPLTNEDISKLWSVFGEKYRPSAAFVASVVLIRTVGRSRSAPPVATANLAVVALSRPRLEAVEPQVISWGPAATIELRGEGLLSTTTIVRFSHGVEANVLPASTGSRLLVRLPAGMPAGVSTATVVHEAQLGPAGTRRAAESNVVAFVVRPVIARRPAAAGGGPDITISNRTDVAGGRVTATVSVRLAPAVGRGQDVSLLLNELQPAAGSDPLGFQVPAVPRLDDVNATTDTVAFDLPALPKRRYLARVRVDGAETELGRGAAGYDRPEIDLR